MRKRKQQATQENLTAIRSNKRYSCYVGGFFDMISVDLVINILSRLPVKSKAKCRCVSKLWSSIIRRPNYNQLFRIKSPDKPRFLFSFEVGKKLLFFSLPQPQNPEANSCLVATRHHHNTNSATNFHKLCRPVRGLVCSQCTEKDYTVAVISNPITGESVTSPKLRKEDLEWKAECYFGYDPIEKQFKVLCIIWFRCGTDKKWGVQHQVLTLETGKRNLLWRKIQCCKPYYFLSDDGICINGVLYYTAMVNDEKRTIVCFDVRSEEFSFINIDQEDLATKRISSSSILINYKGTKLGVIDYDNKNNLLELSVLEDAKKKHKWSNHIHPLPCKWPSFAGTTNSGGEIWLYQSSPALFATMTSSGVSYTRDPFYMFYCNLDRNIMVRVRVEVPESQVFRCRRLYIFANYEEDMKLM